MRRPVGLVLVFLGAFLLIGGLVCVVWAPAKVERVPLSTKNTTKLSGHVTKLGESSDVKATSQTSVDSKKSTGSVITWVNVSCVVKVQSTSDCGSEGTGSSADPNVITVSTDGFATDRHTGESVKFPGTLPSGSTQKSGLVNKWPFDTKKQSYTYWDDVVGQAVPVKYAGTTTLDGLTVYKFTLTITDQSAEIASGTQGKYSQDETFYIEPKTGAIVQQEQHQTRTLDDGTSVLDLSLAFTDQQVKQSVSDAKGNITRLRLVELYLPILGIVIGLAALVVGALASRRGAAPEQTGGRRRETVGV